MLDCFTQPVFSYFKKIQSSDKLRINVHLGQLLTRAIGSDHMGTTVYLDWKDKCLYVWLSNTACFPSQLGFLFKTLTGACLGSIYTKTLTAGKVHRSKHVSSPIAGALEMQKWGVIRDVTDGKSHSWAFKNNSALKLLPFLMTIYCYLQSKIGNCIFLVFKKGIEKS